MQHGHATCKKNLKRSASCALAVLLAAGLLLCGSVGSALAAGPDITINPGQILTISGIGNYGAITLIGGAADGRPSAPGPATLEIASGATLNASSIFGSSPNSSSSEEHYSNVWLGDKGGASSTINLGGGTLTLTGKAGTNSHGELWVASNNSTITGNVVIGDTQGGKGRMTLMAGDWLQNASGDWYVDPSSIVYTSLTINGNLTLYRTTDNVDYGFPDDGVPVGPGATLTVNGATVVSGVSGDSVLNLVGGSPGGKLVSGNGVTVDSGGLILLGGTLDASAGLQEVHVNSGEMQFVGTTGEVITNGRLSVDNWNNYSNAARLTVGTGAIGTITGTLDVAAGTVQIGSDTGPGKLIVNGNAVFCGGNTHPGYLPNAESRLQTYAADRVLEISGNLWLENGAKLEIIGGTAGAYTLVTAGSVTLFSNPDDPPNLEVGWTGTNLSTTSSLLGVSGAWNGSQYELTVTERPGLIPGVPVDPNSPNAGVRYYSRAYDERFNGGRDRRGADALVEGAAELAQVGAVPGMTMAASNAGAGAVTGRTSFHHPQFSGKAMAMHRDADGAIVSGMSAGGDYSRNGLGLWIMPLYQNDSVWGMKAGNFKTGYNSALGGIALGADYTFQEMFRIGAAFNVGGGYARSSGDFSSSDNRFTFWGVNLYGGWAVDNFGVSVEGGYTGTYNDLRQDSGVVGMSELKGDVNSDAWHAGLKAEYRFETPALDIIPHAGVRWMGVHMDSYKVKSSGGTVFKVDDSYQSIWTFPVGVSFAKTFTSESGWTFRPLVDAGVIPATGDVKSRSRVRIPGLAGSADLKVQQVDYVTFDGTAGFEVANGKGFSIGVNYNLQLSEHRTGHGVYGTLRYEF